MNRPVPPPNVVQDLRALTAVELSLPSRVRYVGLLLVASMMTVLVAALLLTEPALPARTSGALGTLAVIGASWSLFATWVLTRKRPLLGYHRVVAARLAVGFCSVFTAGTLAIGYAVSGAWAFTAAAMGAVMLTAALVMQGRARRRFASLSTRRAELERSLSGRAS